MTLATEEELVLSLVVSDDQWASRFDSIEVFRSRLGTAGPWELLTGADWASARLPQGAADAPSAPATGPSVVLVGKVLNLRVQEDVDIDVTFTGSNPLTFAQAATQIATQSNGLLRAYVVGAVLVVETVKVGSAAILRVVGGDAAPRLKLPTIEPDCVAFGLEPRIRLVPDKVTYTFTDRNGSEDYYYRTRFFNSLESTFSGFGEAFSGANTAGLSSAATVIGYVVVADSQGKTRDGLPILIHAKNRGARVEGVTVIGDDLTVVTDLDGRAEFSLIRGQKYTVALGGTDVVRDFTAPTDEAIISFDMFDPAYSSDDAFNVQRPNITFAARRSL